MESLSVIEEIDELAETSVNRSSFVVENPEEKSEFFTCDYSFSGDSKLEIVPDSFIEEEVLSQDADLSLCLRMERLSVDVSLNENDLEQEKLLDITLPKETNANSTRAVYPRNLFDKLMDTPALTKKTANTVLSPERKVALRINNPSSTAASGSTLQFAVEEDLSCEADVGLSSSGQMKTIPIDDVSNDDVLEEEKLVDITLPTITHEWETASSNFFDKIMDSSMYELPEQTGAVMSPEKLGLGSSSEVKNTFIC